MLVLQLAKVFLYLQFFKLDLDEIIAVGHHPGGGSAHKKVELLDTNTNVWSTVQDYPFVMG